MLLSRSPFWRWLVAGLLACCCVGEPRQTSAEEKSNQSAAKPQSVIKYGDGKADGKKSIAGTGEMIEFTLPDASQKLRGLRLHCSRYGTAQAPDEDVEITVLSSAKEDADMVHTEFVPYAKFKRGDNRWTTVRFENPVEVPQSFWIVLDFGAERTKGVYLSYDTDTGGVHSRTGLPGTEAKAVTFEGDWMVQAMLTKPE